MASFEYYGAGTTYFRYWIKDLDGTYDKTSKRNITIYYQKASSSLSDGFSSRTETIENLVSDCIIKCENLEPNTTYRVYLVLIYYEMGTDNVYRPIEIRYPSNDNEYVEHTTLAESVSYPKPAQFTWDPPIVPKEKYEGDLKAQWVSFCNFINEAEKYKSNGQSWTKLPAEDLGDKFKAKDYNDAIGAINKLIGSEKIPIVFSGGIMYADGNSGFNTLSKTVNEWLDSN